MLLYIFLHPKLKLAPSENRKTSPLEHYSPQCLLRPSLFAVIPHSTEKSSWRHDCDGVVKEEFQVTSLYVGGQE